MYAFADVLNQRSEFTPRPRTFSEMERLPEWIQEECGELIVALQVYRLDQDNKALAEIIDGLLDIIYYALGGLLSTGQTLPVLQACFDAVHKANMYKQPTQTMHKLCVKPENFVRPNEEIEKLVSVSAFESLAGRI